MLCVQLKLYYSIFPQFQENMSFQNTYSSLPPLFFAEQNPENSRDQKTILYNAYLADTLGISKIISPENAQEYLSGNMILD